MRACARAVATFASAVSRCASATSIACCDVCRARVDRVLPFVRGERLPEARLRGLDLRLRLPVLRGELHVRDVKLHLRGVELRLREPELRARRVDLRLIVALVDHEQQIAAMDVDVVVDRERDDVAGHLRRDRDRVAVGVGVVGADLIARREPPDERADEQQHDDDREHDERFLAGPLALAGRRVAGPRVARVGVGLFAAPARAFAAGFVVLAAFVVAALGGIVRVGHRASLLCAGHHKARRRFGSRGARRAATRCSLPVCRTPFFAWLTQQETGGPRRAACRGGRSPPARRSCRRCARRAFPSPSLFYKPM
ncbi:Uncharacterised protein [Burkholderia pseudomallei]|nr:Uncharacterised protein [Burkholderia pseudomallei]